MQTRREAGPRSGDHGGTADVRPSGGRAPGAPPAARAVLSAATAAAVVAGVVLRFVTRSDLWLDEALSVNIARLPVADMVDALRHDGHPPLYYLLLHGWMDLFGDGDVAVRALSGVLAVVTLPLAWWAGRRYAGRFGAVATLLLVATSPFAVRYATEARMYALVMLLVTAGWLAVRAAWDRPTPPRLAVVSVVSGLLLLSHYWAFYLVTAAVGVIAWAGWRTADGARRSRAGRLAVALAAGGILFLPWLPAFLDQLGSTGTPWGTPDRPATVLMVSLTDFGGGPYAEAQVLGILTALLAALALWGRATGPYRMELDLRTRADARAEAAVVVGTVTLAVLAMWATDSAFATRYMATVLPLVLLLAALGLTRLLHPAVRTATLVLLVVLGLVGMGRNVIYDRTQGGDVARAVNAAAVDGDVVGFCPDQLGPAVDRYLDADVVTMTYPEGAGPQRVDWSDYQERVDAGDPAAFAERLLAEAGAEGAVWFVWFGGYRTHDRDCEAVANVLGAARPTEVVVEAGEAFEPMWLYRYPAP